MTNATVTRYADLGRQQKTRNHYAAPCAACGKKVAAWKGSLYRTADGTYHVTHACCDAFMALLKTKVRGR